MIAFSCNCGMKFQLKDEFAGRSTKCPTCKQSLTVPAATMAKTAPAPMRVSHVPTDPAHAQAQLVQAGAGGVTLALKQKETSDGAAPRSVSEVLNHSGNHGERYILESEIA